MFAGALLTEGRWRLARALLAVNAGLFAVFLAMVGLDLGGPAADRLVAPWLPQALILLSAAVCLLRATSVPRDRKAWLCASAALACWSVGDLYYQAWVAGAEDQPFPSPADAVWLCFYPFVYATLALLVRGRGRRFELTTWLDGLIGALSVAAVTAAVVFDPLVALTGGDAATVTTNLAYPIGDLLLLGFVVGAFTLHGWRGNRPLVLLGIGLAAAAIADTAFLLGTATGTWTDGSIADAAWPLAAMLVAAAAWHAPADRHRRALDDEEGLRAHAPTVIFAALAVGVLLRDIFAPVNVLAGLAATGAMSVIVVRLVLVGNQQRALERNTMLALTDDLTGLANRRAFYSEAEGRIDRALDAGRAIALLLIDLDRFKDLNDTLGHAAGDDLLRQFSSRLTRAMPDSALLSRLGGDEFVVLLPAGSGEDAARTAARRLTDVLEEPFHLDGLRTKVRASVGAAIAPLHGTDRALLLRHADVAMYQAKTRQTEIEVYAPGEDRHSRERIELAGQLPDAIDHDQLVLHFQPKVELSSGRVAGVEALVRWRHPERGMLGPNEFLPLAEQHGLMRRLTLRGAAPGPASAGRVAAQRHRAADGGEHLGGQPARPALPQRRGGARAPARGARGEPRPRAHGGHPHGRPRGRARRARAARRAGHRPGPRRLRDGLLVAGPPQAPARAGAQDRPVLRAGHGGRRRGRGHRALHRRPGAQPRTARRRRGRRDRGGLRAAGRLRLSRRPGLPPQPPAPRRRSRRLAAAPRHGAGARPLTGRR